MNNKWTLDLDCNDAVALLTQSLEEHGLYVHRSFDLRSAREMLRDPDNCPCPNHGTSYCECQYIVLLIGRMNEIPVSLVAHGHDGLTILSFDQSHPASAEARVLDSVRSVIGMLVTDVVH